MSFNYEELQSIKFILADTAIYSNNQTIAQHAEHCLWQMIRFANLAHKKYEFKAMQFGLNLGRVQELLRSSNMNCWWKKFEKLVNERSFYEITIEVHFYLRQFGLASPSEEFINKV